MAENTSIQWTDHSWNGWWGCMKVSPGCEHCYAETFSKRTGRNIWGPAKTTERWRTKGPWRDILKWDRQAKAEGVRRRVFCQSMSDYFEDHPQLDAWRAEACTILESLEWLDVQMLTKRPENVARMVPAAWMEDWPPHIWMGVSVENQQYADQRIPELLKIPATVRFLSCEPLLNQVNISRYFERKWRREFADVTAYGEMREYEAQAGVDWVIVGGESGPGARPFSLAWARLIVDHCQRAGVPAFVKQLGSNPYDGWLGFEKAYPTDDRKGGNIDEFPEELQVREFPQLELA